MAALAEVLSHLAAAGIRLEAREGALLATPKAALTDEVRALIRAHKPALVALLARPAPPPLTEVERETVAEAIAERAAIREFEAHEPRPVAETQARAGMRVYRVLVAMEPGEPAKWAVLLAPGCDLADAERIAAAQFGPERVARVVEQERRP
jgi:hypothetical protein